MLIYFLAWARNADAWLTAVGYHPPLSLDAVNGPQLPLLPIAALPWIGLGFFACLLAYIFGFARKLVIWPLLAAAIYVLQVDPISSFTINRLFVIGLFVLAIAPEPEPEPKADANADANADASGNDMRQRAWPLRMLQLTLLTQYLASGLCKVGNGDWWGGEDVLWMQVQGIYMTDAAAWMVRVFPHWLWGVLEALALWFELLAPLLFGFRRLLPVAFCLGLGLHIVVAITMDQLIYFSLQMCCFYLLFIPPAWARKLAPASKRSAG
ncbi:MAG: hypothetical protein KC457_09955 [Myxococcales bacterium]|nr:hypothetical protein [Myxococcales bacterium]